MNRIGVVEDVGGACVDRSAPKGLEALCFLSVSAGAEAKRDAGAREIGSHWAHWRVARIFARLRARCLPLVHGFDVGTAAAKRLGLL
ncbi:hypothetical protein C6T56_07565 [Burkholderia multivorans]|nr:hypothetical protein HMPREF3115_17675 [Burkholderia sp. HMSC10F09]PRH22346.1 hypothetical protein C6T56_07565 [Burkholderia multivorans]RSB72956.1 hypothetical protein EGT33_17285 [Burkholderia multivorans]